MNIFWFRRDLRLDDNVGLFQALNDDNEVLPIFIFDDKILSELQKDDARITFIHELLSGIQSKLQEKGKSLAVFKGQPKSIFGKLIEENKIKTVFTNHDYEPYARKRDEEIKQLFLDNNILFKSSKDQVIFEKNEIVKNDGSPYIVYTPYYKKWRQGFSKIKLNHYNSENKLDNLIQHNYPFFSLSEIGFEVSSIKVPPFDISDIVISNYEESRNYPSLNGTSMLGAYLRFGAVSIRKIINHTSNFQNETFLKELIWREFFMQILWHFPHTINWSFKPKYNTIKWKNNEALFEKWCQGKTGYPLVDAGMRELNYTGYMHNRVRMVVASFLCKHLLIDWKWGETYFAQKLLDYEQSSNVGNWQWVAGSGVDAAPYFRIFNPTEQVKKFDKDFKYIKKWVPELETENYPKPIVDHKEARLLCLKTYKAALEVED
jgi:deoxyribodipyrimidine photo-lyase